MLEAGQLKRKGLTGDLICEVTDGGTVAGTINDTRSTMELGGRSFTFQRKGVLRPEFQLKSGDSLIATARQKPLFNHFKLAHAGKEWTYKATNILAMRFGLFEGDRETGSVAAGPLLHRMQGIEADLPEELPLEVRMFLISLAIHVWSQQGGK